MSHAKKYEAGSEFINITERKLCTLFLPDTVYRTLYMAHILQCHTR